MRRLYLDRKSDCEPPAGAVVVDSENGFLDAWDGDGDLVVRGATLCRWAGKVWRGRGWPVIALMSPVEELADCAVEAEEGQLAQFFEDHSRKLSGISRPFRLQTVLETIYPDSLWRTYPSLEHAARWLVWLDENDPQTTVLPLLRTQAMLWRATAKGVEAVLYDAYDAPKAREMLAEWLGYGDAPPANDFPSFPLDVPSKYLTKAKRRWTARIVQSQGRYVQDLVQGRLPRCVREAAAKMTFDYYESHQRDLTQEMIQLLADYLSPETTDVLRSWLPPPTPGAFPSDPSRLRRWFREEYLPYRRWCLYSEDAVGLQKADALAREFASWYLTYYPSAVAGGNQNLAFVRSGRTRSQARNGVTLLVVADGLCMTDAEALVREIVSREQRLTVSASDLLFSPIPTITKTSKMALIHGCTPRDAADMDTVTMAAGGRFVGENQDIAAALRDASEGSFYVWSNLEPDRTYHKHADKQALLDKVAGTLRTLADRIVKVAAAVPAHLRLRILVTTDHGRYLGRSMRTVSAPAGMEPHQRAALGGATKTLPEDGYLIESGGAHALLDGRRFAISDSEDCAVVLSGDCFLTSDGKAGAELFPHGGLYPEEVLIPWFEVDRDAEPPNVVCKATGSGREGRKGEVTLLFTNAGLVDVTLLSAEFQFRGKPKVQILFNEALARQHQMTVKGSIDDWPTPSDLRVAVGVARLRLPVGDEVDVVIELDLKSEGFQERLDILGDLL
jgi:hypothetical protein